MSIKTSDFRYDINALRAIAIIAVVAYHYDIVGFSGGFVGVDIFFVISGFLISSHIVRDLEQQRFSYQSFYETRIRRIIPALAVLCLACTVWGWFFTLPKDYLSYTRHELQALLFVSNHAFSHERGYFDAAAHTKPLLHTWSLSVEGQFYLILPLLLHLLWRFFYRYRLVVLWLVFFLSLAWCIYYSQINADATFYHLTTRAWEFLAGTLLATLAIKKPSVWFANLVSLLGLIFLSISIFVFNADLLWPSTYTVLPVFGTVLLIFSGDTLLTRYCFNSWLLQRLGDISYSLYLWHWSVLVFAKHYSENYLDRELSQTDVLALIALVLLLAIMSWRFIEKPVRFRHGWWTKRRVYQNVGLTLSVFIVLTITAAITKGFPKRLPDYAQRGFAAVTLNTPRSDCFRNELSEKTATEQFCQFGVTQQPSVLLWGDSHANMYLTPLTTAANQAQLSGYIATQTGCRATLANQINDLTGFSGTACTAFNNEVNDFLTKTPNINTVIIARMWGGGDSLQRTLQLIQHLVQQNKKVIVIGAVPYLPFSVPERWIYQQIKANQAIDNMTIAKTSQQHLFDLQQLILQALNPAIVKGQVIWINPLETFCNHAECQLVTQGVCYFKDVTHLSEAGAKLFTQTFFNALTHTVTVR